MRIYEVTERTTAYNSTYKKLADQWLIEASCFVSQVHWWQTVFVSEIANFL